jgi:hypothetical protein
MADADKVFDATCSPANTDGEERRLLGYATKIQLGLRVIE